MAATPFRFHSCLPRERPGRALSRRCRGRPGCRREQQKTEPARCPPRAGCKLLLVTFNFLTVNRASLSPEVIPATRHHFRITRGVAGDGRDVTNVLEIGIALS